MFQHNSDLNRGEGTHLCFTIEIAVGEGTTHGHSYCRAPACRGNSQPPIPSHPSLPPPKTFLCWFNFSLNCFKYFSRGLATFLVFYTASFLFNHISTDKRQLWGRNTPGSGEPCQFFKLLLVSVWFYSWRHLLKMSKSQK